jgi:predicted GIY-YIG superfamily endonuclease
MPKLPIDHSNTTIYKLVHKEDYDNVNIYIGSTTDFIRRKNKHKSCCNCVTNKSHNDKKYQYIRDNGGWDCFNMIEVEKFPCNDGNEARAREEYWRCHFNSQLNSIRAYRTEEQRKEIDKERKREYREHDEYREYQKEYQKKYYYNKKNKTDSSSDDSTECI